jgi:hypothetical protein
MAASKANCGPKSEHIRPVKESESKGERGRIMNAATDRGLVR